MAKRKTDGHERIIDGAATNRHKLVIAGKKGVASPLGPVIISAAVERERKCHGLDDTDARRNLHRAGDQRIPAGRVLIGLVPQGSDPVLRVAQIYFLGWPPLLCRGGCYLAAPRFASLP